jgi:bifunctional non-homologous end joining protein LigD
MEIPPVATSKQRDWNSQVPERFELCQFESAVAWNSSVAFQRRKPAAIGVKAPFPGFIEPALATSVEKVPSGERWIHEIKFDGYRVQVHLANEAAKIFTRRGHDWTHRFKKVAHDAWRIKANSAVVDGEIVVPAADGTTDFSVLQNELKGKSTSIVLVVFDLLYLNGQDIRKLPLFQRKAELKKILTDTDVQFSESFELDGREMFAHACEVGLEGVVSKVRNSPYPTGRTNDWVKKTCAQRETLTIAGFALDGTKWTGSMSAGARARIWSTPAKSTTASTRSRPPICRSALNPSSEGPNPTPSALTTRASGSNPNFWPRSSIARSRPKERSGTRSFGACGRTYDGCIRSLLAMGGQAAEKFADDSGRATSGRHGVRC